MEITVLKTGLNEIEPFRALFLHEGNFQFVYNKCHEYGWADTWLFTIDGAKAGYGSVWGADNRKDRDAIFEFYLMPPFRKYASMVFEKFVIATGPKFIECQSNDALLTLMLYEFARNINTESILYDDNFQIDLVIPGTVFRREIPHDSQSADVGGYILEQNNQIVATGGFFLNYNKPYADIYMEVTEGFRRMGFGSLMVQQLKKEIYLMERAPSARCNINNRASKATLLKAGFKVCGHILKGTVATR
jgi:GNAT superfamily N-acetyltransferase